MNGLIDEYGQSIKKSEDLNSRIKELDIGIKALKSEDKALKVSSTSIDMVSSL